MATPVRAHLSLQHGIPMALFIDVYQLSQAATDDALEHIFKSTHDHDSGIWNPHESLLIRRLVELFTKRGLDRLSAVREQILKWEAGDHHKPTTAPVPRPGMMERWNEAELALVRLYLESLPPSEWSLDDHMMSVDFVVQRYLPATELKTEAEWLTTRAGMMGKVQANLAGAAVTQKTADAVLAALPSTVEAASSLFSLPKIMRQTLDFARARCAENVRALAESVRHRLRGTIVQHLEDKQTQVPGTPGQSWKRSWLTSSACSTVTGAGSP